MHRGRLNPRTPGIRKNGHRDHSYRYPELKLNVIVSNLEPFLPGQTVTLQDLKKPTPALVRRIYEGFADLLMGVSREELNQPVFSGLGELRHPELHEESIPRMALLRKTQVLMEACAYKNFTLQDLLHPTSESLRQQLSAVINLAKFREERIEKYSSYDDAAVDLEEALDQQTEENEALKAKIKEIKLSRELEQPEVDALEREIKELENQVKSAHKEQTKKQAAGEKLKEKYDAVRSEVERLKYQVSQEEEECRTLEGMIVRSPERLRGEISHLQNAVDAEKVALQQLTQKRKDYELRQSSINESKKVIVKAIALMKNVATEQSKCKKMEKELKAGELLVQEMEAEILLEKQKHQSMTRRLEKWGDRAEKTRENLDVKIQAASDLLAENQSELQDLKEQKRADENRVKDLAKEEAALRSEIAKENAVFTQELSARKQVYDSLVNKVESYNRQLLGVIQPNAVPTE